MRNVEAMAVSRFRRLIRFLQGRSVPIVGVCLLIVIGSAASTYTINNLNADARQHTRAVFVIQDLIRNVERLQRAETRLASSNEVPETAFAEFTSPVYQNLDQLRPYLPSEEFRQVLALVRAYDASINTELLQIAASDLDASSLTRNTETIPAATTLFGELNRLDDRHRTGATDAADAAQAWLIIIRATGVLGLCSLLLVYDRQRRRSMSLLGQQENQFRTLIQQSTDIVMVTQLDGTLSYVTPAAEIAFDRSAKDLIGTPLDSFVVREDRIRVSDLVVQAIMAEGRPIKQELRFALADGSVRTMEAVAVDLIDNKAINGVIITAHDVTERKHLLETLHHQAHHDSLTGLPNRVLLSDRLNQAIKRADRDADPIAVLFIDLDEFKTVNDRHGHAVGDELLVTTARTLQGAVRSGDTVARIGGDEFIVLLEQCGREQAEATVGRIQSQLQGVVLRGERYPVVASLGIAVRTDPLVDAELLLRQADTAMYEQKDRPRTSELALIEMNAAAD